MYPQDGSTPPWQGQPPQGQQPAQPQQNPWNQQPYAQNPYAAPHPGQAPYAPAPYPQGYAQQPYAPVYAQPYGAPVMDAQRMMMYDANKKSAGVAYALWFFFGIFGAHRFYLDRSGTGMVQLMGTIMSFFLMIVIVGFFTIWIVAIWTLVDAFLIPDWVRQYNNRLIAGLNA